MEMLNLHRATEPCYLKSTDCVAKLNTKFLLIEINLGGGGGEGMATRRLVKELLPKMVTVNLKSYLQSWVFA